ncbi:hypothetical protein PLICRDRAFT_127352 [Plicaturopsis crispa FD-325 SS-3]|uniref:Unplaced genomic scaffold PLICRscaffold_25, whole genome shotgun sequence n=1 Tax=Plicaturopsis crispa FD-325 SS-3 TaxID=944288 RepID=A0A0C9SQ60_PLICR|nr:hypothetical protein PLICRDRAFT_127352 [Plicaturopsis crispa FD-325 SS-3]
MVHDSIRQRIKDVGLDLFDIKISPKLRDMTFGRPFLSKVIGGNGMMTFPPIDEVKFIDIHPFRNLKLMCANLEYNPFAAQVPGAPGLYYNEIDERDGGWAEAEELTLIVGFDTNVWCHMGRYTMVRVPSLTADEWLAHDKSVRNNWANGIHNSIWGKRIRARIFLRKELHREPTDEEVEDAMSRNDSFKDNVSTAEIHEAYNIGYEHLAVWYMKCVGYDIAFQEYLERRLRTWVPPPPKSKKPTARKSKGVVAKNATKPRDRHKQGGHGGRGRSRGC